jgi:predicted Zn finger-like uncharacterized protein
MPFKTKCPGCAKILDVPDSVVGKRVKCPACAHLWQVPAPSAAPPAAAPARAVGIGAKCPGCGKAIQVPDSAVGKRVKCPACAHVWQVPRPVVDAEAVPGTPGGAMVPAPTAAKKSEWFDDMMGDDYPIAAGQSFVSGPAAAATSPAEPPRRPCPRCGEMIAIGAAKCRFCDAIFDEKLRKSKKKKSRSSSSDDDDNLSTLEWVICIICCLPACIVGIVYMIQGKPKGIKMVGISIAFIVFWNVIQFIIISMSAPHHGLR